MQMKAKGRTRRLRRKTNDKEIKKKRNEKLTEMNGNERKIESHKTKWQTRETEKKASRCKNGVETWNMKSKSKQEMKNEEICIQKKYY